MPVHGAFQPEIGKMPYECTHPSRLLLGHEMPSISDENICPVALLVHYTCELAIIVKP